MKLRHILARILTLALLAGSLMPLGTVQAAGELEPRSVALSNPSGGGSSVYSATFTLATSGQTLGSIKFEICDSPVAGVSCVNTGNSNGATFTGATLGSVTCGACNGAGWTLGSASGSSLYVTHTAAAVTGTPSVTVVLNNVTNPSATNKQFYVRISTYTDTAASSPAYPGTDFGGIAVSTSQALSITGTMPESLVFCVGNTVSSDCTSASGSAVALGTFSPSATATGTSQMAASTNAASGYVITVNGSIPQSGGNSIAAMGTQSANSGACAPSCTSAVGSAQFGSNTVANNLASASPNNFGAGVTPTGAGYAGSSTGGYATANSFRFFTGDTVASANNVSNGQTFTNSYIVNVPGSQAAGLYTTTLTYVCTATF